MISKKLNLKIINIVIIGILGISFCSCKRMGKLHKDHKRSSTTKTSNKYNQLIIGEWQAYELYKDNEGEDVYDLYMYYDEDGTFNYYEKNYLDGVLIVESDIIGTYKVDGKRIKYKIDEEGSTFWADSDYHDRDDIKELRKYYSKFDDDEIIEISSKKMVLREVTTGDETFWKR